MRVLTDPIEIREFRVRHIKKLCNQAKRKAHRSLITFLACLVIVSAALALTTSFLAIAMLGLDYILPQCFVNL